jgi:hypothetical protein
MDILWKGKPSYILVKIVASPIVLSRTGDKEVSFRQSVLYPRINRERPLELNPTEASLVNGWLN